MLLELVVETEVEGDVQRPLGVTDAMGVVLAITWSLSSENAQVAAEQ